MPIDGPSSYLTTVPLFLNHWEDANVAKGSAITLDGDACGQPGAPLERGTLAGMFDDLEALREVVEATLLEGAIARAEALALRVACHDFCEQFNATMRADYPTLPHAQILSDVPQVSMGRELFLRLTRGTHRLWAKVNAYLAGLVPARPPIVLQGGTTAVALEAELGELRVKFDAVEEREQQASLDRRFRDAQQDVIYQVLKVYRLKIPTVFPEESPLVETLPALTTDSTKTPAAPSAAGSWNAVSSEADLTGTASVSTTVVRHQWRGCPGEEYQSEDESILANIPLGQPLTFSTTFGLGVPGTVCGYRLVAITADGHEKGSEAVYVSRPL